MGIKRNFLILLSIVLGLSGLSLFNACGLDGEFTVKDGTSETEPQDSGDEQKSHLEFFGYVGIDCGLDDPTDGETKTEYIDEVSAHTNVGHLCANSPIEDLKPRIAKFIESGIRPIIDISQILYIENDGDSTDGKVYSLRGDAQARWQSFLDSNDTTYIAANINSFYIVDEPFHHNVPESEFRESLDIVKNSFPNIPTLTIEASVAVDRFIWPDTLDWAGFDHYGVLNPSIDVEFLQELNTLRGLKSKATQKLILTMEGQWLDYYTDEGYEREIMSEIAQNYFKLANDDSDVVLVIGYSWPGGIDGPNHQGVRTLPKVVKDVHITIGKSITSK